MVQPRTSPAHEDELELPPSDGETPEGDEELPAADDVAPLPADAADPYDDETGEGDPLDAELGSDDEPSAVGDDDVGFAVSEQEVPEIALSEAALGDEEPPGVQGEDFGIAFDERDEVRDAGEEGFDAAEPELRVEDLPQLDEGDDEELSLEEAIEPGAMPTAELRWDDRSFERVALHRIGHVVGLRARGGLEVARADGSALRSVDGGRTFSAADHVELDDEAMVVRGRARALLREGVGVLRALGDGSLTALESTARATAFTLLEDGTVIAAVEADGDRSQLVSVSVEGTCTIVADVSMECDDEAHGGSATVDALAADERAGLIWAGGAFGLLALRMPSK